MDELSYKKVFAPQTKGNLEDVYWGELNYLNNWYKTIKNMRFMENKTLR